MLTPRLLIDPNDLTAERSLAAFPSRWSRIGLASLLSFGLACSPERTASPPNDILLISLDTLRADHLSAYGYDRRTSPFIDNLCEESVRFANAYSSASNTAPSHMSLLTGLDPLAHGIRPVGKSKENLTSLSPQTPMLAERLRQVGYQTIGIADNGYVMSSMGFDRGFDAFSNERSSLPYKLTLLSNALKHTNPDLPLFLFFHTYETHAPYLPPPPFHGRFTDPDYDGPFRERYDALASLPVQSAWKEKGKFLETWEGMNETDLDYLRGLYDEGISYTDSNVQRLWDIWSRRRNADETLLIIVSDHGEGFNEHGKLGHKYGLYSELLRVPLIIRNPAFPPSVVEHSVSLTDVVPTIFDFLDLPLEQLQGESFLKSLRGEREPPRSAFSQLNAKRGLHDSVFRDEHHLLRWNREGDEQVELFEHGSEPADSMNVADDRVEVVRELKALLDARKKIGDEHHQLYPNSVGPKITEEERERLEGLGYVEGVGYDEQE